MSTTVLVAEDEMLIAMDVMDELDMAGFQTIGPFPDTSGALDYCQRKLPDCAVLDVRLRDGESYPLADWLAAQQVPVVFHSAHASVRELSARYPNARVCPKPATKSALVEVVAQLCDARGAQVSTYRGNTTAGGGSPVPGLSRLGASGAPAPPTLEKVRAPA